MTAVVDALQPVRCRGWIEAQDVAGTCGSRSCVQMSADSLTIDSALGIVHDGLSHEPNQRLA